MTRRSNLLAWLLVAALARGESRALAADGTTSLSDGPPQSSDRVDLLMAPANSRGPLNQANSPTGKFNRPTVGGYRALGRAQAPGFVTPAQAKPASDVMNLDDVVHLEKLVPIDATPIRIASLTTDTVPYANEVVQPVESQLPPGTRDGVFQKLLFTATWAPQLSEEPDTLGVTDLETGVVFGFPLMQRAAPLLVTPRFGVHLFENSVALDIPSTVYDASVEFRHLRKFGAGPWAMDVAATVGYYSDFEIDSSEALRVTGRGLAVYESSPTTKWILGVAYLNRAGASVLPVGGVIYAPNKDVSWELIFPRPRIAWQTADSYPGDESWWYVGGEFGGGVWAVERRSTSMLDVVSYNDLRVMFGYERTIVGGINRRYEFGYVFDREIDYESATADVSLDDALFVRAGLTY